MPHLGSSATRKDAFDLRAWLLPDIVRVNVCVLYCESDHRVGIFKKYFTMDRYTVVTLKSE